VNQHSVFRHEVKPMQTYGLGFMPSLRTVCVQKRDMTETLILSLSERKFLAGVVSVFELIENVSSHCCRLNGRLAVRNMANEGLRRQTLISLAEGQRKSQVRRCSVLSCSLLKLQKSVLMNVTRTVGTPSQKYDELA
jgi:hypothetical protein